MIDDVWQQVQAEGLVQVAGPYCALLLTGRDSQLLNRFATKPQRRTLRPLPDEAGYQLLYRLAPAACDGDPALARRLSDRLGGLPLSIELVGGYLRDEGSPFSFLSEVRGEAFEHLDSAANRLALVCRRLESPERRTGLGDVLRLSLDQLPAEAQAPFVVLGGMAPKPATFHYTAALALAEIDEATLKPLSGAPFAGKWEDEASGGVVFAPSVCGSA